MVENCKSKQKCRVLGLTLSKRYFFKIYTKQVIPIKVENVRADARHRTFYTLLLHVAAERRRRESYWRASKALAVTDTGAQTCLGFRGYGSHRSKALCFQEAPEEEGAGDTYWS